MSSAGAQPSSASTLEWTFPIPFADPPFSFVPGVLEAAAVLCRPWLALRGAAVALRMGPSAITTVRSEDLLRAVMSLALEMARAIPHGVQGSVIELSSDHTEEGVAIEVTLWLGASDPQTDALVRDHLDAGLCETSPATVHAEHVGGRLVLVADPTAEPTLRLVVPCAAR